MDNEPKEAPVIPQGTEPTVYGTASYQKETGQAQVSPEANQPSGQQPQPASTEGLPKKTTYEELAAKKNFKSPDDLAEAYENLEKKATVVGMGLADLSKARTEAQPQTALDQELADIDRQVETQEDAIKVVEKIIRRHTAPLEDKIALQELFFKHPDATQFAAAMAKRVKEEPGISWDSAYKLAKFDSLQDTAKAEGKQEAYQAIQQKQAAEVTPSRPASKEANPIVDVIRDRSIPFSEVQRIMKERFSQPSR